MDRTDVTDLEGEIQQADPGRTVYVLVGDLLWHCTAAADYRGDLIITPTVVSDRDLPDD